MPEQFAKPTRGFLFDTQMSFHTLKNRFHKFERRIDSFQITEKNHFVFRVGFNLHFKHNRSFTDASFRAQNNALPTQTAPDSLD